MVCKRDSFRTDECVELWIVGESILLRWIGELDRGDISGNAQKLQPPVNSASLIPAVQRKPLHRDAKIDLPFQMPQDQDAFLLISRIYINTCQNAVFTVHSCFHQIPNAAFVAVVDIAAVWICLAGGTIERAYTPLCQQIQYAKLS